MPSRKQPYDVTSVLATSVSSLLAKVQILHFVQNDKTQFLFPVSCSLFAAAMPSREHS